jgi:hypothetical protein
MNQPRDSHDRWKLDAALRVEDARRGADLSFRFIVIQSSSPGRYSTRANFICASEGRDARQIVATTDVEWIEAYLAELAYAADLKSASRGGL